jgi:hypothetical protein
MVDENRATQVYTDRMNQLINQEANAANPNSGMLFDPNQRMLAPNVVGEGFDPERIISEKMAPPDLVQAVKSGLITPQQAADALTERRGARSDAEMIDGIRFSENFGEFKSLFPNVGITEGQFWDLKGRIGAEINALGSEPIAPADVPTTPMGFGVPELDNEPLVPADVPTRPMGSGATSDAELEEYRRALSNDFGALNNLQDRRPLKWIG